MQIKFLNKNNNSWFNIDEGAVITQNYNETLDSATIRISQLTTKPDIEPYDLCVLNDTRLGDMYMCVDTRNTTQTGLDPIIYQVELTLFSQTKLLEGVILPNLSITQLKANKRSVWYYLQQYLNEYCPLIRVGVENDWEYTKKWSFDANCATKFNVECPEMQWNTPTLREVFNDLMMVADCIPVLKNGVIGFIDLTKRNDEITNYNYIQETQSSADYVSELQMDMQNVMQTSVDGVTNTIIKNEQFFLECPENEYVVNSDNILIKTKNPILQIKHLWFGFFAMYDTGAQSVPYRPIYLEQDLCHIKGTNDTDYANLVYEKKEHTTKNVLYRLTDITTQQRNMFTEWQKYQNLTLYYTRGGNTIENLTNVNKGWLWFTSELVGELMIKIAHNCSGDYDATPLELSGGNTNYFRPFIRIEYETTADSVFRAGKSILPTNDRVVIDNQTNSYVDAYNQGNLEYQKANRLGNNQVLINARFESDYTDLYVLGDIYSDNVIYQLQYQVYKNHIEVNAIATKDYILRNYFTGVKSKIRSWVNAQDEAFIRHDLKKYYCEMSFSEVDAEFEWQEQQLEALFWSPFNVSNVNYVKYGAIKTTSGDTQYPAGNYSYAVEEIARIIGNSIVFTVQFPENQSIGKHPDIELSNVSVDTGHVPHIHLDDESTYGGIPLQIYKYVDDALEFDNIQIKYFSSDLKLNENFDTWDLSTAGQTTNDLKQNIYSHYQLPKFADNQLTGEVLEHTLSLHKDNREIPAISTQFEFCTDTKDIIFTKRFLELQQVVRNVANNYSSFKIYYGSKYDYIAPKLPNDKQLVSGSFIVDGKELEISLTQTIDLRNKSLYICDANDKIILACNVNQQYVNDVVIYMNLLRTRNKNIYDVNGLIVGHI